MRRFFGILFTLLAAMSALTADAQQFTNDWVNFSQDYYRLSIPRTGVYRVTRSQLESAGVPIGKFNQQNIQLFQNGRALPCHIASSRQGLVDYIEFFAEGNDGWFDVDMYDKPENQTNPHYSLITDTAAVFLTWNNSFSNLRFQEYGSQGASGYSQAAYCIIDTVVQYVGTYLGGEENCRYTDAEGWFDGTALALGKQVEKTVPTPAVSKIDGLKARVTLALATYSSNGHHISVSGPGINVDTIFYGLHTVKRTAKVAASQLSQNNKYTFSSIDDISAKTDYSRVSFVEIEYPSEFNFKGRSQQVFRLPPSDETQRIAISGMDFSDSPVLYDVSRNLRVELIVAGGTATALIEAHRDTIKLVVATQKAIGKSPWISHAPMTNHAVAGKRMLMISNQQLMGKAREYAAYRDAYLVDIEEIYNQFGYGVRKHPMAIRRFVEYVTAKWSVKPQYLFIVGKAVNAVDSRRNATGYSQCFVPSMGYPASDALLTAYINGSGDAPLLATGRLAALNVTQVDNYLSKVKEFESNKPDDWMKRVIHFVGGSKASEQREIGGYMSEYERIIEDTLFGGSVSTFRKLTSDPISTSKNDSVKLLINGGVSLMTFFGHGSTTSGFDRDVDVPANYKNQGKYPLILSNSCYTGNIHATYQSSASEEWVLAKDRGAIGLIAMVNEGVPYYLDKFSSRFYSQIANHCYGEPIGKAMRTAQVMMSGSSNRLIIGTLQQFSLHGDPCIVLNSATKPDLRIEAANVWFTPSLLTTAVDSFTVNVALRNAGRAVTTDFVVELQHVFSNGGSEVIARQVLGLKYRDTLRIRLPMDRVRCPGLNRFIIKLDAMEQIAETDEQNNSVEVTTFVQSLDMVPVLPHNYSLVNAVPKVLKASVFEAEPKLQTCEFQIDTTEKFNSRRLTSQFVENTGGVVECNPTAAIDTGRAFYWRVRGGESDDYSSAQSFVVRSGQTGWEQSHFEQLDDNEFQHIKPDNASRSFDFAPAARSIRCHNFGSPNSSNYMKLGFEMDGFFGLSSCGAYNALLMVVVDSFSLIPWQSDRGSYGQSNYPHCSSADFENYFIFYLWSVDAGLDSLISMVENHVPDGNYILIYSFISGRFQQWPERAYDAFERWGSTQIRTVNSSVPYIFFTHKGYPDEAEEVIGKSATDIIDFDRTLYNNFNRGTITSPPIGPSRQWQRLEWKCDTSECAPGTEAFVRVVGLDTLGGSRVLIDSLTASRASLSNIDAKFYPQLRLQMYTQDDIKRIPAQLKMWRVLYSPYTDLAINTNHGWLFNSDTLREGERGTVVLAYENIGQQPSDSLLVHYWIQTATNRIVDIGYQRLAPLRPGGYVVGTVQFETTGLDADNVFCAELNPVPPGGKNYDQQEQTHFNNFANKQFHVLRDVVNPLLDVTFDGRHIANGDIVSSRPAIAISVTDANRFLAVTDTNSIAVYITDLATGIESRVELVDNPEVTFTPGTLARNRASIVLQMPFGEGDYQLRVRAHDVSGNESGDSDYTIAFRIVEENVFTDMVAFPNPFSSSARFAFELGGSELPDEFRIDIYNPAGTIVKTLTAADFGGLHFGLNVSTVWNGTYTNGALLPAGIYFYKVRVALRGTQLPIRNFSSRAPALNNGVGRLVIVR